MQNAARCPNCDREASGSYCPACGQKQTGRLTVGQLAGEFAARFFQAERGLWRTLADLTLRPGRAVRHYLDGRRRRYVSPLLWYVLGATAVLLGLWLLREVATQPLVDALPEPYFAMLRDAGHADPEQWVANRYVVLMQNAYTWLGLLTFVLPTALMLRATVGHRLNLAEALVFSLFTIGQTMIYTALLGQVLTRISPDWQFWCSQALYDLVVVWAIGDCLGWSWRAALGGLVSIVAGCTAFFFTIRHLIGLGLTSWI